VSLAAAAEERPDLVARINTQGWHECWCGADEHIRAQKRLWVGSRRVLVRSRWRCHAQKRLWVGSRRVLVRNRWRCTRKNATGWGHVEC
jgi:hypothetical protein